MTTTRQTAKRKALYLESHRSHRAHMRLPKRHQKPHNVSFFSSFSSYPTSNLKNTQHPIPLCAHNHYIVIRSFESIITIPICLGEYNHYYFIMRAPVVRFTALLFLGSKSFPYAAAADENADARLLAACTSPRGQDPVEEVIAALEEGANMNAKQERGGRQTCFMAAALRGKLKILKHLFAAGADVNIPEGGGFTPPHGAGFQGRPDVMQFLKEEVGMDVINPGDAPHPDGFAPFHRACWGKEQRHADTVEYLLSIGEDVNRRGTGDRTQTCAEMTQNPATIAVLKKYGAEGLVKKADKKEMGKTDEL